MLHTCVFAGGTKVGTEKLRDSVRTSSKYQKVLYCLNCCLIFLLVSSHRTSRVSEDGSYGKLPMKKYR